MEAARWGRREIDARSNVDIRLGGDDDDGRRREGTAVDSCVAGTRWGLRDDYRFLITKSNNDAPSFFGRDSRYGHRLYAGVIINAAR